VPSQQKTPLAESLNALATKVVAAAIAQLGKSLPCSVESNDGNTVTVTFEVTSTPFTLPQVSMAVAMSEYARIPTPKGTKGLCVPADVYIGNITGLGSSTPGDLTRRANLSQLIFVPVSNKNWDEVDPTAVVLFDTSKTSTVTVSESEVELSNGSNSVKVGSTGFSINSQVNWPISQTSTSCSSGAGGTVPTTYQGCFDYYLNGVLVKIPYFNA